MKLEEIKRLSDEQLLRVGFCVGREIDRRWSGQKGDGPPHFQDCKDVFAYFHYRLWAKKQEYLCCLLLNHKNQLVGERVISIGTVNSSLIHAREVFAPAIEKRASGILLIHNHPSGNATPSPEDLEVTQRLKKVGKLIGIPLLDHLIIGKNQYYSDSVKTVVHL